MVVSVLAALFLVSLVSGQHYLNLVSLGEHSKARCNDGTAAVYYRQPLDSPGTGARKLLLYLQGGGFCVPGGCDHRCRLKAGKRLQCLSLDTDLSAGVTRTGA